MSAPVRWKKIGGVCCAAAVHLTVVATCYAQAPVDYDVVAVQAPRRGDNNLTKWQEVAFPASVEPGQNLIVRRTNGTIETLVDCASGCAVVDPAISFDGTTVYYSLYPDVTSSGINSQRSLPYRGADIYKMDLTTKTPVRLTAQEFTPNTGVANWTADPVGTNRTTGQTRLGYGILNLGPFPFVGPDGGEWIVFTSNRNAFTPPKGLTGPTLQVFIMDGSGRNVQQVGHLNLGSALHPVTLKDGRIMFSTSEAQGVRDDRNWSLWAMYPDGRNFEPLMSSLLEAATFHFQTQLSNGAIAVTEYYNLNNNGFGTVLAFSPERRSDQPNFGSPVPGDASNPSVRRGRWFFDSSHPSHLKPMYKQYPFSPIGLLNLTAFTHGEDEASSRTLSGAYAGKVTHPSGAPGNDLLLVWSPGPANHLDRPTPRPYYQGGIYLLKGGIAIDDPAQLVTLISNPSFNYQQPRAVVPYQRVYGVEKPTQLPFLPESSTPYGLIGTSSFYNRNTSPGIGSSRFNGLDPFNTGENNASTNWVHQGADAGRYTNSDIHAVRILAMEPTSHLSYGPDGYEHTRGGFMSVANERLRILGEIPLRKFNSDGSQPQDGDGNPDTSFLARIPADVPFTFQTIDKDGLVLNMSQTWHHVRPGEKRFDCGGCHAHANKPTDFSKTVAAKPDYQVWDLVDTVTLLSKDSQGSSVLKSYGGADRKRFMDVEYVRDIKPIFERSCVSCHSGATPPAGLNLSDGAGSNFGAAYLCIADDKDASCSGYKPVISNGVWRQTNLSRYIRAFQARRSLLVWKIFGRRLDGWSNADHPTESVPGNASTLPSGADRNTADLDFTGTIMPPPGSGVQPLSEDEKMMIARWIDLGAPSNRLNNSEPGANWFTDDLRPTLHIVSPQPRTVKDVTRIEFVATDYYSGLDASSLTVSANFQVNGAAAGQNIAAQAVHQGGGRWILQISDAPKDLAAATVTVEIADAAKNRTKNTLSFAISATAGDPELPQATPTPGSGPTATPFPGTTPGVTPVPTGTPGSTPAPGTSRPRMGSIAKIKGTVGRSMKVQLVLSNAASAAKPVTFSFSGGMPKGVKISKQGLVRGKPKAAGTFTAQVWATNRMGISERVKLKIVVKRAGTARQ